MSETARPALFLDRDGVLNIDRGYVYRVEDFEWVDGAIECVKHFNELGWWVFVVTNQSGIARGYYTEAQMQTLHDYMSEELAKAGAHIDKFYHCPFHEAGEIDRYRRDSDLRKPKPGMLIQAMLDYPVIAEQSFMIGDKATDMEAAAAARVTGFYFQGGNVCDFAKEALSDLSKL